MRRERGRRAGVVPAHRLYRAWEHYLTVARVTKAARHFSEGVQLFRGLGDAQTAAWLRGRLAFAQATVAAARRRPVATETPKARAAVGSLVEALQAFADTVADEELVPWRPFRRRDHQREARARRGQAGRGAGSLALAVMAPPQDAPAALMTRRSSPPTRTIGDGGRRALSSRSGGSTDALTHLQQATAFADKAAQSRRVAPGPSTLYRRAATSPPCC